MNETDYELSRAESNLMSCIDVWLKLLPQSEIEVKVSEVIDYMERQVDELG